MCCVQCFCIHRWVLTVCCENLSGPEAGEAALTVLHCAKEDDVLLKAYDYTLAITALYDARVLPLYEEMITRGIAIPLATYSKLLRACVKAQLWQTVLQLFTEMHALAVTPRSYDDALRACAHLNQADTALELFEEVKLVTKGAVGTHAALFTVMACRADHRWQDALAVLHALSSTQCRIEQTVTHAVLRVCAKAGRHVEARQLFYSFMPQHRVQPTVMCYDALMEACVIGGEWQQALDVYAEFRNKNVPDLGMYHTLLRAYRYGFKVSVL
jgi:pentatricopeptide repeat protein